MFRRSPASCGRCPVQPHATVVQVNNRARGVTASSPVRCALHRTSLCPGQLLTGNPSAPSNSSPAITSNHPLCTATNHPRRSLWRRRVYASAVDASCPCKFFTCTCALQLHACMPRVERFISTYIDTGVDSHCLHLYYSSMEEGSNRCMHACMRSCTAQSQHCEAGLVGTLRASVAAWPMTPRELLIWVLGLWLVDRKCAQSRQRHTLTERNHESATGPSIHIVAIRASPGTWALLSSC